MRRASRITLGLLLNSLVYATMQGSEAKVAAVDIAEDFAGYHYRENQEGEKIFESSQFPGFEALAAYTQRARNFKNTTYRAVLVISGGWNSCQDGGPLGNGLYFRALDFLNKEADNGRYYRVIASCYWKVSRSEYYTSSSDFRNIREGSQQAIIDQIEREFQFTENNFVYLIGHSYGGWLTIVTALNLSLNATIRGLVTLDPISKHNCTPQTLFRAYMLSQFKLRPHEGCTEAPAMEDDARIELVNRSGSWFNFYQDAAIYLHSGKIRGAANYYLSYDVDHIFEIFAPHTRSDTDERAWSVIESFIGDD